MNREQLKGEAKQAFGEAFDDKKLQAEGAVEAGAGKAIEKAKEVGEKVKEGLADAKEKVEEKIDELKNK